MKSMKVLLRILGTVTFSALSVTTVIACSDNSSNPVVKMDKQISENLGLTTGDEQGTQEAKLYLDSNHTVYWNINALTPIKASALLDGNNKAKDQPSYDFITKTLNVQPTTGSSLVDGIFNNSKLDTIVGNVTNINPTLTKLVTNDGYGIASGTFNFQFKDNNGVGANLGNNYTINLKPDATNDAFNGVLAGSVSSFKITDTDVATNNKILFKVNEQVGTNVDGTTIEIKTNTSEETKIFASLKSLTGLTITAQIASHTNAGPNWTINDTLVINYKTSDITFNPLVDVTTLTLS